MAFGENEVIHLKFALREGTIGDWAMYVGLGDWDDSRVLDQGHKLSGELAPALVHELKSMGLTKKDWHLLKWRD
ncbi:MAG: hypothetical protein J3T61_03230 [Candidatus Brocadiales bacterium]|nr:hypothetical protein [Candidatus Bathyanammoxibius sp.]